MTVAEYVKKTLQEMRDFLKDKELCFACYKGAHRSNGCAQRRTCKTCSRRHPTGLHDDSVRLDRAVTKNQNPSSGQSLNDVTTSRIETEEAVCSVVGTGNPVTAVPIVPVRLIAGGNEVLTYALLDALSEYGETWPGPLLWTILSVLATVLRNKTKRAKS